jgi:hypothetical protein
MIDYNETGAILYPTMVQNAPMAPSVDAKPTIEPAATKPAEPRAADPGTTTAQQNPDAPSALTLPKDAVIEAKAIERTMAFAKAAGLSPDAAQQALEHANGEVAAYQEQVSNDWNTLTRETWLTETQNDPEVGGEKYVGTVTDAKRFLEKFGDEELLQFLDDTGFGNNRLVIRLLARAEKGITNTRRLPVVSGGAGEPKTAAQKMYPYMKP